MSKIGLPIGILLVIVGFLVIFVTNNECRVIIGTLLEMPAGFLIGYHGCAVYEQWKYRNY